MRYAFENSEPSMELNFIYWTLKKKWNDNEFEA